MPATVNQILDVVEELAPPDLALDWDRVGLQVGSRRQPVHCLAVALEPSLPVVQGAIAAGAQMLLTHHPLLFQPLTRLDVDTPTGRLLHLAIQHDLAIAAAHTNLDIAVNGLNDFLAAYLELEEVEVLQETSREPLFKLAVFVPKGYENPVRQAICDDNVGVIGRYAQCSFTSPGEGTYMPLPGSHPSQGEIGQLSRAPESRLEVIVPARELPRVLTRLRAAHPYEEIAYDIYPRHNPGLPLGLGRLGRWPRAKTFPYLVHLLKERFQVPALRVAGQPPASIEKVALCGGSGGELLELALSRGAQAFISGDLRYHQVVPFSQAPLAICDVGHFPTEAVFIPPWAQQLRQGLDQARLPVEVITDRWGQDPFRYV